MPGGGLGDPLGGPVDHLGACDQIGLILGSPEKGLEARAAQTVSVRTSEAQRPKRNLWAHSGPHPLIGTPEFLEDESGTRYSKFPWDDLSHCHQVSKNKWKPIKGARKAPQGRGREEVF